MSTKYSQEPGGNRLVNDERSLQDAGRPEPSSGQKPFNKVSQFAETIGESVTLHRFTGCSRLYFVLSLPKLLTMSVTRALASVCRRPRSVVRHVHGTRPGKYRTDSVSPTTRPGNHSFVRIRNPKLIYGILVCLRSDPFASNDVYSRICTSSSLQVCTLHRRVHHPKVLRASPKGSTCCPAILPLPNLQARLLETVGVHEACIRVSV